MDRLFVRIQKDDKSDPELYQVSAKERAVDLVAHLQEALRLPSQDRNGVQIIYWLETSDGCLIRDTESLNDARIVDETLIYIRSGATKPPKLASEDDRDAGVAAGSGKSARVSERTKAGPDDSESKFPPVPPTWKKIK